MLVFSDGFYKTRCSKTESYCAPSNNIKDPILGFDRHLCNLTRNLKRKTLAGLGLL